MALWLSESEIANFNASNWNFGEHKGAILTRPAQDVDVLAVLFLVQVVLKDGGDEDGPVLQSTDSYRW